MGGDIAININCSIIMAAIFLSIFVLIFFGIKTTMNNNKKSQRDKVDEVFNRMVVKESFSYVDDKGIMASKFPFKKAPEINNVIYKKNNGNRFYLSDIIITKNIKDRSITNESKDINIEKYLTCLTFDAQIETEGLIKIKPRHIPVGYSEGIPYIEGDKIPEEVEGFSKKYLIKTFNAKDEEIKEILNSNIQKALISRFSTYPINSGIQWIKFYKDNISIECSRISTLNSLKELVILGEQIKERLS